MMRKLQLAVLAFLLVCSIISCDNQTQQSQTDAAIPSVVSTAIENTAAAAEETQQPILPKILATNTKKAVVTNPLLTESLINNETVVAPVKHKKKLPKAQRIKEALLEEERRTKDITLGYIPRERYMQAVEQTRRRQLELMTATDREDISNTRWRERGPSNVGGRTNAIMVDKNDPARKKIWIASSGGGLWTTDDVTLPQPTWKPINDYWGSIAIGAICQDATNPQVMYCGTGDRHDARGVGIFKSTDGGNTWTYLSNTANAAFSYVNAMVVNPANGHVYAACNSSLQRSTDGGTTWQNISAGEKHDVEIASNGVLYVGGVANILRSTTGNSGDWENLGTKPGYPANFNRVELTICTSDPNTIYMVGSDGGEASHIYSSNNGGDSWAKKGRPENADFTNGQVWYDLDIFVNPNNPNQVFVGGIDLYSSQNGGTSWASISSWFGGPPQYVHADQHSMAFQDGSGDVAYFGNDGGIWRTSNAQASVPEIEDKNYGYNTTLFYTCAMHPDSASNYFLAGAQDNGSNQLNSQDIALSREVLGGDGFICHIDQDNPNIQMVTLYDGEYALSVNGGISFSGGQNLNDGFYTNSDYDDDANTLYANTNDATFYRWQVDNSDNPVPVDIAGLSSGTNEVSTIYCDPNTPHRVYFGTYGQNRIFRLDNANVASGTVAASAVLNVPSNGVISSIDVEQGNANHILITISNYGAAASVLESTDGGTTWTNVEGTNIADNLPDVPVRWGVFNPKDATQAIIATEVGVWTTNKLQGANTEWFPPVPGRGAPLARTTMLQVRQSDKTVLASTFGRGLWTSGAFGDPAAVMAFDAVHYTASPAKFDASFSNGDQSYSWNFGDGGATSDQIKATHTYANIGTYPVSLTINGSLTTDGNIKILPDLTLPYIEGNSDWGGNFDNNDEQYGAHSTNGSKFTKGNSTITGKSGTHSGDNAYVLGINEVYYQPNTNAMLYLPNFNMTESGIYEFSFWGKWSLQQGFDGLILQYSLDRGQTWQQIGNVSSTWYQTNAPGDAAFPEGTPMFSKNFNGFKEFKTDISELSGNSDVAFRFLFRSEGSGNYAGVVIDDVQINKYTGDLRTRVTELSGEFDGTDIPLAFTTQPEYFCQRLEVEYSENGRDFTLANQGGQPSKVTTSSYETFYNYTFNGANKDLYYFRVKAISEVASVRDSVYSKTIVVRRQNVADGEVYLVYPNPFTDIISVAFTGVPAEPVKFDIFNSAGQLVYELETTLDAPFFELSNLAFTQGVYLLRIQVGDKDPKTIKLFGGVR